MRGVLGEEQPAKLLWRRSAERFLAVYRLTLVMPALLSVVGLIWSTGATSAPTLTHVATLAVVALTSSFALAFGLHWLSRKLNIRRLLAAVFILTSSSALGLFALNERMRGIVAPPSDFESWACGYGLAFAAAGLLITALLGGYIWFSEALDDIERFNSSLSSAEAALLWIAVPIIVAIAGWAAHEETEKRIPEAATWIAVVGLVAFCIAMSWAYRLIHPRHRSYRADDGWPGRAWDIIVTFAANILTVGDYLLARPIAVVAGAKNRFRLIWLALHFGLCVAIISSASHLRHRWGLVGTIWAILLTAGLARRWAWAESDRRRSLEQPNGDVEHRIAAGRDLRSVVLMALAALILVITPLSLQYTGRTFDLFGDANDRWSFFQWLSFVGGELIKAIPLVDWSEVYKVGNSAEPRGVKIPGQHVLFAIRAMMDLIVIAAMTRAISSSARLRSLRARFHDPMDSLQWLDPIVQQQAFKAAGEDWAICEELAIYDEERLKLALSNSREWTRAAAKGAARLAGWQLAEAPLTLLIEADPDEDGERLEQRRRLETFAAEGLDRRAQALKGAIPKEAISCVTRALRTPANQISEADWVDIHAALAQLERRRRIEVIIHRRECAPEERKKRLDNELNNILRDEDPRVLIQHLKSSRTVLAKDAAYALRYVWPRPPEVEQALIDALRANDTIVRIAAARTLGRIGSGAVFDILAQRLADGLDTHSALRAIYRLAERSVRRREAIFLLLDFLDADAPISLKMECLNILAKLQAREAIERLLVIVEHGGWTRGRPAPLPWSHTDTDYRMQAIRTLQAIRDRRVLDRLRRLQKTIGFGRPRLREAIAAAVSAISTPPSKPTAAR